MTVDELFLYTLEDLDSRLSFGRCEYDVLMAAGLLRKLLDNGLRSLLAQVAEPRGVDVKFHVNPTKPAPTIQLWTPDMLFPEPGAPVVELDQRGFLSWPAVVVMDGEAQVTLSVGDLIRYLANNQGAVHASIPRKPKEFALQRFNRMRRFGPDWQYSGGVHGSREIARVVLAAVSDLRQRVTSETWPAGYPSGSRG